MYYCYSANLHVFIGFEIHILCITHVLNSRTVFLLIKITKDIGLAVKTQGPSSSPLAPPHMPSGQARGPFRLSK